MRTINHRSCLTIPSMFKKKCNVGRLRTCSVIEKSRGRSSWCCVCPLCCSFWWVGASHRDNLKHLFPLDRNVQELIHHLWWRPITTKTLLIGKMIVCMLCFKSSSGGRSTKTDQLTSQTHSYWVLDGYYHLLVKSNKWSIINAAFWLVELLPGYML